MGIGLAGLLGLVLVRVTLSVNTSGDYATSARIGGDNAAPGIDALLHGSVVGYLQHQPIVGLASILLRMPAVAIASDFGAHGLAIYQVGAIACLAPLALGAAWLVTEHNLSGRERLFRLLAVLLVLASPILHSSIAAGHPEGVLAICLAVGAVIAASRGHARRAAMLLGVGIAAKETAVIAIAPVLLALPKQRRDVCLIAAAVLVVLQGVPWLADPAAVNRALHVEGTTRLVIPLSLIWPLTSPVGFAGQMPLHLDRAEATLLVMAPAALLGSWWFAAARRRGASCNPLALLALLGVLRCVCDSTHELYYYISVLVPLAAWEALESRPPVVSALTVLIVPLLFDGLGRLPSYLLYFGSTLSELSLVMYLARRALVPAPAMLIASRRAPHAERERRRVALT